MLAKQTGAHILIPSGTDTIFKPLFHMNKNLFTCQKDLPRQIGLRKNFFEQCCVLNRSLKSPTHTHTTHSAERKKKTAMTFIFVSYMNTTSIQFVIFLAKRNAQYKTLFVSTFCLSPCAPRRTWSAFMGVAWFHDVFVISLFPLKKKHTHTHIVQKPVLIPLIISSLWSLLFIPRPF